MKQYIYAIVDTEYERATGMQGIGDLQSIEEINNEVSIVCFNDMGAVVSPTLIEDFPVNRKNTLAHQKIMEELFKEYTVLPVKFGTIGDDVQTIREKVLKAEQLRIKEHLDFLKDKSELGLKVFWVHPETIFTRILEENPKIQRLRDRLNSRNGGLQREQIQLGDMVENALKNKKKDVEKQIFKFLTGLFVDHKKSKILSDNMVVNSVFLVSKEAEKLFDKAVEKIDECFAGQLKMKYIGPVPPSNFVELTVRW
ncbi:MAG: GvpL/GvpF family gas vesicle protein [Proteobacteria bacterium]|nr:GvpL/GvpF family gas vesicle protein [Pseudomonadota bacterium]MBU1585169.1 GvpL/GvpF family gas vesicle protein [Pseudomonadota bacterium]MBU2431849.1 GvpL/GvpF family gas vesicle protein [Pseudomonadota bacterium]MBU2454482.1 GvpL/GvpF family gas vesicle protein [Pseudomonadota bacterium]MBU2629059.1 GvpL/GvpF family gas vesicle protein [Pseudomonadota bacterium]